MSAFFVFIKYKIWKNIKSSLLSFISLSISMILITLVLVLNRNSETLNATISNAYLNYPFARIYKKERINESQEEIEIFEYVRPSLVELKNINLFSKSKIDVNFDFLFENVEIYLNDKNVNTIISFEPYYDESNSFISNFEFEGVLNIKIKKDLEFEFYNEKIIDNIKLDFSIVSNIKEFEFLSEKTIYYPYKYIKKVLIEKTVRNINWYDHLLELDSKNDLTSYSLYCFSSDYKDLDTIIQNKELSALYDIESSNYEKKKSFLEFYSSLLDFSKVFCIVILILAIVLLLYSIYFSITKDRKEIALLKSYGLSNTKCSLLSVFEINIILFFSLVLSIVLSFFILLIIKQYFFKIFAICIDFSIINATNIPLFYISILMGCNFLLLIPLYFIRKVNIKKELNLV